jgi:hypothetical protein
MEQSPAREATNNSLKKLHTLVWKKRSFISVFTSICHWSLPEPDESSLQLPTLFPFSLCLGLLSGLFRSGFLTKFRMHLLSLPFVLRDPPISFSLSWSPEQYMVKRKSYEAPHYVIFSSLQHFLPLRSSVPCSQTPSIYLVSVYD